MSKQNVVKRNLFAELMEGVGAMKAHREGKLTLRTHRFPIPEIKDPPGAEFFVAAREKFNVSRSVWANMLRVSPRTVEKWEQGGQVSPLAATFVELVSQYPDTIERLQTLPKRIARSEGKSIHLAPKVESFNEDKKENPVNAAERLRLRYRPQKVRALFVAEAPPAGGTFFYQGNSQLYRNLKEVLLPHWSDEQNFLDAFKDHGYFLEDLTHEPVGGISVRERSAILRQSVPLLAKRLTKYQPQIVVTLLKRISEYVEDAISLAALDLPHYSVPFPGNGQQVRFRQQMKEILPLLP
jgi:DNA-binding transcriptional regulator YiaG